MEGKKKIGAKSFLKFRLNQDKLELKRISLGKLFQLSTININIYVLVVRRFALKAILIEIQQYFLRPV